MKRIFFIILYTITLTSISNAEVNYKKFLIEEKDSSYGLYNMIIADFNSYIKDIYSDKSCNSLPTTKKFLMEWANCTYRYTKKYMRRNEVNFKEVVDAEHDAYIELYERAKILSKKWLTDNRSTKKMEKEWNAYWDLWEEIYTEKNFYLKEFFQKYAALEQAKYDREMAPSGPSIGDDEIIPVSSGTGFLISYEGHIVTNYHVIEGCKKVNAIFKGTEYLSKILATDRVNDLAILKTNIKPKKIYPVSNEDGQLLEDVIIAGFPLGKKVSTAIKATTGSVTALAGLGDNYAEFQTDAALNSGNSGGPIINEMGNVVGVAVSKIQEEGVESFNFGIKSSVLKVFANANGISFVSPSTKIMKKKELGYLITEATIYIDCWMSGKELKKLIAASQNSKKAIYNKYKK